MADILMIEDRENLVRAVRDRLQRSGHRVEARADGESGLAEALERRYDVIILDVALPRLDGFEVCRRYREHDVHTPILILTAAVQLDDRVRGLTLGADDYLTKPFEMAELVARVNALLRRASLRSDAGVRVVGGLELDFVHGEVRRGGERVDLSDLELRLIQYLVEREGRVVSREELLANVWKYNEVPMTRTVDVRIAAIRQKLEEDPARPKRIVTVHGAGYRFVPE